MNVLKLRGNLMSHRLFSYLNIQSVNSSYMMSKLLVLLLLTYYFPGYTKTAILKVVTLDYAPSAFIDEKGNASGIHVDIAKEAFARMGIEYKIEFMPWKRAMYTVNKGDADCIIDPAYNEERAKYCYFPKEASHVDQWCFFMKKGNTINIDKDLKGLEKLSIAVTDAFEYGGVLQTAIEENRFERIDKVTDKLLLRMLQYGRVDVIAGEKSNILYKAKKNSIMDKIEMVKSPETGEVLIISESPTYTAFSKKTMKIGFVNKFSDIISAIKKDGTYEKIRSRYIK